MSVAAGRRVTLSCPFCATLNRVDLARVDARPKCGQCGRPLLLDRPLAVTDQTFDRLIGDAEVPVFVDFYADWCGPCKVIAPILDDIARERMGELLVLKLDTDRNPGTMTRFGVRGIPTLILFAHGAEVARLTGAVPRAQIDALLAAERR
ncbi:MAG: thiol reductase thioredoxin [Gemmatimonadetes bacterium]|nr:MAG: thiol reductase thioredoxin [Gemmatimonadota bacterium]PYP32288.1 MAG: thiol reductase thioredoxin [Gemmatimonadota bacterium]